MVKVITYGTYDLLHYGHINLLKNAKALGDYLIVGVTAEDFDRARGKINVKQSLAERIEAVRTTGIADEIIVEEYEGQKIDDIKRYGVDIFTVGSDWEGKFDYLKEYCKVVYLKRTEGVSSTELRAKLKPLKIGFVGTAPYIKKFINETKFVAGLTPVGICTGGEKLPDSLKGFSTTKNYEEFLNEVDAVYIASQPKKREKQIRLAIERGKHVLCESPVALDKNVCEELFDLAEKKGVTLTESIKTAYSMAYYRLLLMAKSGKIGKIVSVDATCTSLKDFNVSDAESEPKSIYEWGPNALLAVFQLLGTDYRSKSMAVAFLDEKNRVDAFTDIRFVYDGAVANVKVGRGVKSEGELIVSGTKGYIYVPAPWWKTEYFEIRFEDPAENKRFFFQLDGEGIRYELVSFVKQAESRKNFSYVEKKVSVAIAEIAEHFEEGVDVVKINIQ